MSNILLPGSYSIASASNGYPPIFVNQSAIPDTSSVQNGVPGSSGQTTAPGTGNQPTNPSASNPDRTAIQGPAKVQAMIGSLNKWNVQQQQDGTLSIVEQASGLSLGYVNASDGSGPVLEANNQTFYWPISPSSIPGYYHILGPNTLVTLDAINGNDVVLAVANVTLENYQSWNFTNFSVNI